MTKKFQPTKLIYLASPYSHESKDIMRSRFEMVTKVAAKLQDTYEYAFILPITMSHVTAGYMKNKGTSFADWEIRDLTYLSKCDELWVVCLKGWEESKGVEAEIAFAAKQKIPIKYLPIKMKS